MRKGSKASSEGDLVDIENAKLLLPFEWNNP